MKNSYCITPIDEEMALLTHAVYLLNEFKKLGFETRRSFIQVMADKLPAYINPEGLRQLDTFWAARIKNEQVNADVEKVLEQLKSE